MPQRPSKLLHWAHTHPFIFSFIIFSALVSLTAFHQPDPDSPDFQWPGLLPSSHSKFSLANHDSGSLLYSSPRLTKSQEKRYNHLRNPHVPGSARLLRGKGKYMFVTITRNIEDKMPDLLQTFSTIVSFLGPDKVYFSIFEGPSTDNTAEILEDGFKPMLVKMGVPEDHIRLKTRGKSIPWDKVNRIQALAVFRNEATSPLWHGWEDTAAIVFFNDIFFTARDALELLHQHVKAGEQFGKEIGMTSGLDWWKRHPEYFYDVWVARTIEGDLFYPIETPYWTASADLFQSSKYSRQAYDSLKPFQAFSTWNGMVVLAATPFLEPFNVRYRKGRIDEGECPMAECNQLATDFWKHGWGRVQIIPSVQVAYDREASLDILETLYHQHRELGWSDGVPPAHLDEYTVFQTEPPELIRCHPWPEEPGLDHNVWKNTTWVPPW